MMLDGKIAVVTGSGSGIGRGVALSLAKKGATVVCLSLTEKKLIETVSEIEAEGFCAEYITVDVTDFENIEKTVQRIVNKHGKIDLWVNNAGINNAIGPTWEVDTKIWRKEIDVLFYGVYNGTYSVLKQMVKQDNGRIINVAGGGVARPLVYASAYSAAKTAVVRFTETVAMELVEEGLSVKVFGLGPGLVKTGLTKGLAYSDVGMKYMPGICDLLEGEGLNTPEEVGDLVVEIATGSLDGYNGKVLSVTQDLQELKNNVDEHIASESFTLRIK